MGVAMLLNILNVLAAWTVVSVATGLAVAPVFARRLR